MENQEMLNTLIARKHKYDSGAWNKSAHEAY